MHRRNINEKSSLKNLCSYPNLYGLPVNAANLGPSSFFSSSFFEAAAAGAVGAAGAASGLASLLERNRDANQGRREKKF